MELYGSALLQWQEINERLEKSEQLLGELVKICHCSLIPTLTSSLHLLDHKGQILVSVTCVLVFTLRANRTVFTEVKLLLLNGGLLAWIFLDLILGDPVNSSLEATTRSSLALPLSLRALFILGSAMPRGFPEPLCGCSGETQAPDFTGNMKAPPNLRACSNQVCIPD